MTMPRLSVIIPTFRRFAPLLDTIEAVLAQKDAEFEIIVVDQNPAWPEELEGRKNLLAVNRHVRWLTREKPGVVDARHDAVEVAQGGIFVFIDDDVAIPDPHFLARHAANYDAMPGLDAVIGREVYAEHAKPAIAPFPPAPGTLDAGLPFAGTARDQAIRFDRMRPERYAAASFCTCTSSCTRDAFFRVGGFDESFHGNAYGDDYDFAIRLSEAGGRFVYDPQAWLIHLQVPAGGLRMSDTRIRRTEKEKIYASMLFFVKYGAPPWRGYLGWRMLRRSVLLKANLKAPWRQPAVWAGLWQAWREARAAAKRGAWSRFTKGRA